MNNNKIFRFFFITASLVMFNAAAQAQVNVENGVKFTAFSVKADKKKISINWATDNTTPANYFEIQKSLDGVHFKTIALVLGPDPKQQHCDCYAGFDIAISKQRKNSFYRLIHIGTDGSEQISETRQPVKV